MFCPFLKNNCIEDCALCRKDEEGKICCSFTSISMDMEFLSNNFSGLFEYGCSFDEYISDVRDEIKKLKDSLDESLNSIDESLNSIDETIEKGFMYLPEHLIIPDNDNIVEGLSEIKDVIENDLG